MYRHPKYNKSIIDNDIAMLKLPKSVPLPYACLPKNVSLPTGQNCTIVGWGKTSPYDYIGSSILREAQVLPKNINIKKMTNIFLNFRFLL